MSRAAILHGGRRAGSTAAALLAALALGIAPAHADRSGARHATAVVASTGESLYRSICQGCHMPDGRGAAGAGRYPALAGDAALASTEFVALTLLQGRRNMPAFGGPPDPDPFFNPNPPALNDEQIAAVVNYVRTHFGNRFKGSISAAQVQALRASLPAR